MNIVDSVVANCRTSLLHVCHDGLHTFIANKLSKKV